LVVTIADDCFFARGHATNFIMAQNRSAYLLAPAAAEATHRLFCHRRQKVVTAEPDIKDRKSNAILQRTMFRFDLPGSD
jgi:hypothetical protein